MYLKLPIDNPLKITLDILNRFYLFVNALFCNVWHKLKSSLAYKSFIFLHH